MLDKGYDFFIIYTADPHLSEYVSEVDKAREYLTGFTGSAGTLVVSRESAFLWVDGRYFIQAENQLLGSEIQLMRLGEKGVPSVNDFLKDNCPCKGLIAIDGKTVSKKDIDKIRTVIGDDILIDLNAEIPMSVWPERKLRVFNNIRCIDINHAGVSNETKINDIREKIEIYNKSSEDEYAIVISELTSIMWILNLRGSDIKSVPVAFSYLLIYRDKVEFFAELNCLSRETVRFLSDSGISCVDYKSFYTKLKLISGFCIFADPARNNSLIFECLSGNNIVEINEDDVVTKYIKNETEISFMRKYHIQDAVSMIHFIFDIKKKAENQLLPDEYGAGLLLDEYRMSNDECYDLSFDTISAYGKNAALPHYSASQSDCSRLLSKGLYLVDSGGQYPSCTTDITRTIVLGPCSEREKIYYTAVLKGNLNLADAVFLKGCRGENLDILARKPIWELGADYRHGTGHGIGCELSVHEGPISIRHRIIKDWVQPILCEGMILSDEPGIYFENEFGIRLENELLIVKKNENEWGTFLGFDSLTLVPFDKEAILPELLTERELKLLNDYHAKVYDNLKSFFDGEELEWLRNETTPIKV